MSSSIDSASLRTYNRSFDDLSASTIDGSTSADTASWLGDGAIFEGAERGRGTRLANCRGCVWSWSDGDKSEEGGGTVWIMCASCDDLGFESRWTTGVLGVGGPFGDAPRDGFSDILGSSMIFSGWDIILGSEGRKLELILAVTGPAAPIGIIRNQEARL